MPLYRLLLAALLALCVGTPAASWAQSAKPAATKRDAGAAAAQAGFLVEPIPAWVRPLAVEDAASATATPLHYLVLDSQVRVGGAAQEERFERRVTLVQQAAGLEMASQVSIDFDPSYQTLVLHRVELQRGTQRLDRLERRKVRLLQRETRLEEQMVDGRLTASLVLEDVRVGDRVEMAYSVRGANPVFGGRFVDNDWMRAWRAPASLMQYRLLAPADRAIRHRIASPAVEVDSRVVGSERETLFRRRAVPQAVPEADMPGNAYQDDLLQLSEFADWAAVAHWAQGLFRPDGAPMPGVKAQAAAIAAAAGADPQERLRRALDFVQREVRYFGTEMGANSHRPAAPEKVLAQRFGDCKDKAALLVALLRELGVEAAPVLVSTVARARVQELLPSPLAFDHVIARVTLADGGTAWLDATRGFQSGPVAERQSYQLGHGLPAAAGVTALAALPSGADELRLQAEDTLLAPGFADEPELQARITFHGPLAEHMRQYVASASAEKLGQWLLGEYARVYAGAYLKEPLRVEAEDGHNRLRVSMSLVLPRYWRLNDKATLLGDMGFPLLMDVLRLPNQVPRREALRLFEPGIYRHSVALELDEDVTAKESDQRFEDATPWFRLQVRTLNRLRGGRMEGEVHMREHIVPAAQWQGYRDKLTQLWPKLSDTYTVFSVRSAEVAKAQAQLEALAEAGRRGTLRLATKRQVDMVSAIVLQDAQLASGRLNPRLRAQVLLARGYNNDHMGRARAARADFEEALTLRPNDAEAHAALAVNAMARADHEGALRSAQRALELAPGDTGARFTLARARYELGEADAALQALQPLLAGTGTQRDYALLWRHLALRRGAQAADAAAQPPAPQAWPGPVLRALRGELTADQVRAAIQAAGASAAPSTSQPMARSASPSAAQSAQPNLEALCELYFYLGEQALLDGDAARARELFQKSVDTGVVEFVEHQTARRRLAGLTR